MSLEQAVHSRSSANGFGRRRGEREMGTRLENKSQSGKSNAGRKLTNAGSKIGSYENSPSRDRLVYLSTCTIGNQVEVQLKNGDIYSGIFHASNAEKDFGVILKMARMIKDGGSRGQKSSAESLSRAPLKTIIIHPKELVQVIAKQVSISRDGCLDDIRSEKQKELMIDSHISQSRHVDAGRELAPWVPDEDVPRPELENIFDGPWKSRGWDQFRANEALFGVKSTFDEELYTTKLERGSLTREREKEAQRIAREIEGEETLDIHLAEERGLHVSENFDIDEETRFSSVYRGKGVDDSGYEENEDVLFDTHNDETFGGSSESAITSSADWTKEKRNDVARVMSSSSAVDQAESSQSIAGVDLSRSGSYDHSSQLASESLESCLSTASESRINNSQPSEQGVVDEANEFIEKQTLVEEAQMSKYDDPQFSLMEKKDNSDKGLSPNANSNAPSHVSSKGHEKSTSNDLKAVGLVTGRTQTVNSHGRPGSSVSSSSDGTLAASAPGPGLSPSSSMGSMSSEKSTLNPHAKEFKLNPNAKSFVPSLTPVRPPSPVAEGSYYFPHNMPGVPQMPGMPVGIGINPSFAHQHVMYPQAGPLQAPQTYFHPSQPQYQQMIMGQHRPVLYMPNYQPEMPYKGREY